MDKLDPKVSHRPTREELAKVLQAAVLKHVFETLEKVDLRPDEFRSFFKGVWHETDRALAIVAFSYIDDRMRDLFANELSPQISGGVDSLLGPLQPLGTSSARIQMAAALHWINPLVYSNLGLLRKIRNEFAHNPFASGFEDPRIAGLLSSMMAIEDKFVPSGRHERITSRQRFFVRSVAVCQAMISDMTINPPAIRSGLSPSLAHNHEFERLPESVRQLAYAAVDLVGECLEIEFTKG